MATFTNQATLSYQNTVVNSNLATGQLLEALSVTKTALSGTYESGEKVTYIVSVLNAGGTAMTGVTVSDDLGAYAFGTQTLYPLSYVENSVHMYANGVLQTAPAVSVGPPLVFSGLTVPANGNLILAYEAETNAYAPRGTGSALTNTASVTGGDLAEAVTAQATVAPVDRPVLEISKSMNPTVVTGNDRLTYTFVIQNTGNTAVTATDNTVLTDTFDPLLRDLTVTYNGTVWSAPLQYTYNETTGLFETVGGQITVPAASYTQNASTGAWETTPGYATLIVTGTV